VTRASVFYWDFFGPNAAATAEHFKRHLDQFLGQNGCQGCETGLSSAGTGHQAVFCRTPEPWREGIAAALKPRRTE
jgi:hypothetical protein